MTTVAAIGERTRVDGFALAGVLVQVADAAAEVRTAWQALPSDVAVVLLTPSAAAVLDAECAATWPMTVVLPVVLP
ncbi:MAG TPA: V-type ATP synthase subunit F [Pseudonocardiaceae bacterium]